MSPVRAAVGVDRPYRSFWLAIQSAKRFSPSDRNNNKDTVERLKADRECTRIHIHTLDSNPAPRDSAVVAAFCPVPLRVCATTAGFFPSHRVDLFLSHDQGARREKRYLRSSRARPRVYLFLLCSLFYLRNVRGTLDKLHDARINAPMRVWFITLLIREFLGLFWRYASGGCACMCVLYVYMCVRAYDRKGERKRHDTLARDCPPEFID